jgi:CheY-like chemotaxis protein
VLKDDGFIILTAGDGEAALEASRNHPGPVDLLLTSQEMPGMSGLKLCRIIAAERPGIKTLMMLGDIRGRELVSTIGLPTLQKPFTPTDLRDSIEALLAPIPHVKPFFGLVRSGVMRDLEILKIDMIAYRAKIVALLSILEGGVKTLGNAPIVRAPARDMSTLRKPIAAARVAKAAKKSKGNTNSAAREIYCIRARKQA